MIAESPVEVQVKGMDCASCVRHVEKAISGVAGVRSVEVSLAAEKAVVQLDPVHPAPLAHIVSAVRSAGYMVPDTDTPVGKREPIPAVYQKIGVIFGLVVGLVLLFSVGGEALGWLDPMETFVPRPIGWLIVLALGFPIFWRVLREGIKGRILSHTLMTMGAFAALFVGEWTTAAVVVVFMRIGDYVEKLTAERARRSLKNLLELAPKTALRWNGSDGTEVPVSEIRTGELVLVRPGSRIPVDGHVIEGHAAVDQGPITGESLPVEVGPGTRVFASTFIHGGRLILKATEVGADTTFGRLITLVERAESERGETQRLADRVSAWYMPVVGSIAILTFMLSGNVMASVAVLVVACSCAFALATPVAILASVGAGARQGILIKGGRYIESLARADVLLLDKTGTVTIGRPHITDIVEYDGFDRNRILRYAAAAEQVSEHPLARAVCRLATDERIDLPAVEDFEAVPGFGVRARIEARDIVLGSRRFTGIGDISPAVRHLEQDGKSILYLTIDGVPAGALAAADEEREDARRTIDHLKEMGFKTIELITGDHPQAAARLADRLGLPYRAGLMPEEKIGIVEEYQRKGHTVVMVGDGVNDAPALARADVGIGMGVLGSDVAVEAAHVALMREDWRLLPEVFAIARRTMRVVRLNIGFTIVYNLVGLSLAALGWLPPMAAAAAQSLPDLGIMANSARLLRNKPSLPLQHT